MTQEPMDPRPLLRQTLDQADALVARTTTDDLDRPTPCDDWTVRDLVGHLIGVERRIAHIATGGRPEEVPASSEGVADDGWYAAWRADRARLEETLADDRLLGGIWHHPAGDMPGAMAMAIYASEFAVHNWDLAVALGVSSADLDQRAAEAVLGPISAALPPEPRGGPIPFGPVVSVAEDAPAYDRLVGWLGRDPAWSA